MAVPDSGLDEGPADAGMVCPPTAGKMNVDVVKDDRKNWIKLDEKNRDGETQSRHNLTNHRLEHFTVSTCLAFRGMVVVVA